MPSNTTKVKLSEKQKGKHVFNLYALSVVETHFNCDKCDEETSYSEDAAEASDSAYADGWRPTERNCYCPKCAKKYLKS